MSCREKAEGTEGWKTCPLRLAVSGRYWLPATGNRVSVYQTPLFSSFIFCVSLIRIFFVQERLSQIDVKKCKRRTLLLNPAKILISAQLRGFHLHFTSVFLSLSLFSQNKCSPFNTLIKIHMALCDPDHL